MCSARIALAVVSLVALSGSAHGNLASLTGGTLSVAHSWTGTPITGHSGGSNSSSNTHGATFIDTAVSSTPGSAATIGIFDINQVGNVLSTSLSVTWGTTPPVPTGTRTFTLDASLNEGFNLSSAADWSSNLFASDPDFPYSVFEIQTPGGGSPAIDLLAAPQLSGTLSAGNYNLYAEAAGQWSFSGTDFLKQSGMQITFAASAVPEPGAFVCVGLVGAASSLCRRKRRRADR